MKERETEKVGDNDESADLKGRKNKTLAAKKKKNVDDGCAFFSSRLASWTAIRLFCCSPWR